jgi:AcrR family transcriptional regulator
MSGLIRMANRDAFLTEAERLIRTRGYLAFRLDELTSRETARDHGFASKEELCASLIRHKVDQTRSALRDIRLDYHDAESRLISFACIYFEDFEEGLPSLPQALGVARIGTPVAIRNQVARLSRLQLNWIQTVVKEHWESGAKKGTISSEHAAHVLLSALEGDAITECALGVPEPSATGFIAALALLGICSNQASHTKD